MANEKVLGVLDALREDGSIEKSEDGIFLTLCELASLYHSNHRGASETYLKLGEMLVGKVTFHAFYEKFSKIVNEKGI